MAAAHDLSLRQLQYVVAIADTLGFHRAAERCHVSQPTLSAQVQQLEAVLGVRIFERDRRRVLITPAGEEIVARARRVLLEVDDLLAAVERARDPLAGSLRVGVIPTVAPYLLPEITPAMTERYPRLRLAFREEKTEQVAADLAGGALDVGIVALVPELGAFAHAEIADDPFVLAAPKGHPLTKKKRVELGDVEGETVLLLDDGHCFRTQALALCARVGAREAADLRATSLSTLVQMVSSGAGVTLLPRLAVPVENRRAQLEIRAFKEPAPSRTIALVWRPGSPLAEPLRELAGALKKALRASQAA